MHSKAQHSMGVAGRRQVDPTQARRHALLMLKSDTRGISFCRSVNDSAVQHTRQLTVTHNSI
jgi:hypothetical protein